jgi:hypothetical protein
VTNEAVQKLLHDLGPWELISQGRPFPDRIIITIKSQRSGVLYSTYLLAVEDAHLKATIPLWIRSFCDDRERSLPIRKKLLDKAGASS